MRQILLARGAAHHDARCSRNDQRRNLRHQTVAHGQQRITPDCLAQPHAVLQQPHRNPAHQVDQKDDHAGDGVPAHELGCAVHCAIKIRFASDLATPRARFAFVDESRIQVGIDRQLLARHRVEGEARRHLGDAPGALGNDDEIDDDQDQENHEADRDIAADQEIAEGFDHLARSVRSRLSPHQNNAGGGDVERQTQQGGQQQHRGKHRKIERAPRIQAHQHHDHRQRDIER